MAVRVIEAANREAIEMAIEAAAEALNSGDPARDIGSAWHHIDDLLIDGYHRRLARAVLDAAAAASGVDRVHEFTAV